jgi:hypothetical protein
VRRRLVGGASGAKRLNCRELISPLLSDLVAHRGIGIGYNAPTSARHLLAALASARFSAVPVRLRARRNETDLSADGSDGADLSRDLRNLCSAGAPDDTAGWRENSVQSGGDNQSIARWSFNRGAELKYQSVWPTLGDT